MAHEHDHDHLREALLDVLLDKVAADRYPSATMMNQIEAILEPDELPAYVEALLERIREDTFPSIDLIRRVEALVAG